MVHVFKKVQTKCTMTHKGRPRSLILVPIESA